VKVWGNLKKGDKALQVYCIGETVERKHDVVVKSVGRRWITVTHPAGHDPTKFDAEAGFGEYGYSLHTKATYAEKRERIATVRVLATTRWDQMSIYTLRAVKMLVDGEGGRDSV